jgi:hypothetical protein
VAALNRVPSLDLRLIRLAAAHPRQVFDAHELFVVRSVIQFAHIKNNFFKYIVESFSRHSFYRSEFIP